MRAGQPTPRRILLAPDSFKGTLSNIGVARAMAAACERIWPGCALDICPVADGGEGTLEALKAPWSLSIKHAHVASPMAGQPDIQAQWALSATESGKAVVELASVAGLASVEPEKRDPLLASTHGLGMLLEVVRRHEVRELIIALGGSCTVDGGIGALGALGVGCTKDDGEAVPTPIPGGALEGIAQIDVPERLTQDWAKIHLRLAVDVQSPLLGDHGAARVYGPQKGATPQAIVRLDAGLANVARLLKQDPMRPGTGAAGGVPVGLMGVLGGELESGLRLVLDACDFDERCRRSDLVLTGEGALDSQSRMGKAAVGVALRAQDLGVPTVAVVGSRNDDFGTLAPFSRVVSLSEHVAEATAKGDPVGSIIQSMESALG